MKRYGLFAKNSDEVINSILSRSLEEAKNYFVFQKQLSIEIFDHLFDIRIIN